MIDEGPFVVCGVTERDDVDPVPFGVEHRIHLRPRVALRLREISDAVNAVDHAFSALQPQRSFHTGAPGVEIDKRHRRAPIGKHPSCGQSDTGLS